MRIDDFIWLPDVLDTIESKHRVTQDEVEEVFFNKARFRFVESGYRADEDVYLAMGQTDAGRYLIVFTDKDTVLLSSAEAAVGTPRPTFATFLIREYPREWCP